LHAGGGGAVERESDDKHQAFEPAGMLQGVVF